MMYSCRKSPELKSLLFCEAEEGRGASERKLKVWSVRLWATALCDSASDIFVSGWVPKWFALTRFIEKSLKYFNKKLMDFDAKCSSQYQSYISQPQYASTCD